MDKNSEGRMMEPFAFLGQVVVGGSCYNNRVQIFIYVLDDIYMVKVVSNPLLWGKALLLNSIYLSIFRFQFPKKECRRIPGKVVHLGLPNPAVFMIHSLSLQFLL
jgi:hypothetical protein